MTTPPSSPGFEWRAIYALLAEIECCHEHFEATGVQHGLHTTGDVLMAEVDRLDELLEANGISWIEV